jgi:hypothetical protein
VTASVSVVKMNTGMTASLAAPQLAERAPVSSSPALAQ